MPIRNLVALMRKIRHAFPPSGPAYELFDNSVFLLVLGAVGYIITEPTPVTDNALYAPFRILGHLFGDPQAAWGAMLVLVALFGIGCSFANRRWLEIGYRVVITVCLFASTSFVMGLLLFGASPRAVISAFLYGWIASGLHRARRLYPFREVPW